MNMANAETVGRERDESLRSELERKTSSTANESTAARDGGLRDTISRPAATGDDDGDVRRRRNCGRYSAPGQNAPAVSTHEFAEAYRRWLWEYSLWTQSCLLLCSVPPLPTPYGNLSQVFGGMAPVAVVNGSAPGTASGQPPAGPVRFAQVRFAQQQNEVNRPHVLAGKECQVPALWKRVVAEFIDFFLLFVMKLVASIMFIDYIGIDIEKYDIDKLLAQEWDSDTALLFTSDLIAMEIANRIFICLFETFCLRQGFAGSIGGTTPGKYLMRLRVISCQSVAQLPGNKVLVIPGNDIGFWNALLRSVIKNFSLVFFFPVCFTAFFIPNSRTAYDISSSSIVVEVTPENLWAWPRR